jgi:hypothetical protein
LWPGSPYGETVECCGTRRECLVAEILAMRGVDNAGEIAHSVVEALDSEPSDDSEPEYGLGYMQGRGAS